MITENLLTPEDLFLEEFHKGNVAKANLIDTDFESLVKQYNDGNITFVEYSEQFYTLAVNLIKQRLKTILF